jgi:hypothetical protein
MLNYLGEFPMSIRSKTVIVALYTLALGVFLNGCDSGAEDSEQQVETSNMPNIPNMPPLPADTCDSNYDICKMKCNGEADCIAECDYGLSTCEGHVGEGHFDGTDCLENLRKCYEACSGNASRRLACASQCTANMNEYENNDCKSYADEIFEEMSAVE